jgi:hypothetical protein
MRNLFVILFSIIVSLLNGQVRRIAYYNKIEGDLRDPKNIKFSKEITGNDTIKKNRKVYRAIFCDDVVASIECKLNNKLISSSRRNKNKIENLIYDKYGNYVEISTYSKNDSVPRFKKLFIRKYDDSGNQIQLTILNKKGRNLNFIYDQEGISINYDSLSSPPFKIFSKYDLNGREYETVLLDEKNQISEPIGFEFPAISKSIYDEIGNLTEFSTFDVQGKINSKNVWKHDDFGNLIEEALYDQNDELIFDIKKWKYDSSFREIEEIHCNKDGTIQELIKTKYFSENGKKVIEKSFYNSNKELTEDSRGCAIERTVYDENSHIGKTYYFDKNNVEIIQKK